MPGPTGPVHEALRATLAEVRKELLDLGLRNPLLNYRLLKSKGLELCDVSPKEAFQDLVTEGRELLFVSLEEAGSQDGGLPTKLNDKELEKRLLATYYAAKTSIEEQGVITLFLALGMLRWREPEDQEVVRYAPLLLIPVELERKSAGEGFRLKYSGDDIAPNVCLVEFLKQSFGIELKDLAESDDLSVEHYFSAVGEAIAQQDGWGVDRESVALGFFSFSKFLMYRDLDPATWDDEASLLNHDLLNRLLGTGSFSGDSSDFSDGDFVDDHLAVNPPSHVLDADSTQSLAILDIATGRNTVIQGPPGTGKSQTIVNLIAEAMASGKKVLFVAEKREALNVVKQRLDKIGLGPACLELHSNKAKKKEVIEELKRTASLQNRSSPRNHLDESILHVARTQLNDYCKAVNTPIGGSEETIHDLYGVLLPILARLEGTEIPQIELRESLQWTPVEVHRRRSIASRLQDDLRELGVPCHHIFWGSQLRNTLPTTRESVRQALNRVSETCRSLGNAAVHLAALLERETPQSKDELLALCTNARQMASAPGLSALDLSDSDWTRQEARVRRGIAAGNRYEAIRAEWRDTIKSAAWSADIADLEASAKRIWNKWWRAIWPRWKRIRREVAGLINGPLPKSSDGIVKILQAIREASENRKELESCDPLLSKLFGRFWQGEASDWKLLEHQLDWIASTAQGIQSGQFQSWCLTNVQRLPAREGLLVAVSEVERLHSDHGRECGRVTEVLKLDLASGGGIQTAMKDISPERAAEFWKGLAAQVHQLDMLVAYGQVRDECLADGLGGIAALADHWDRGKNHLLDIFDYARVSVLLEAAYQANPVLARFDASQHTAQVNDFRQMDSRALRLTSLKLAQSHASAIPKPAASNGQVGVLWREFEKKGRYLPIRKLILKAGNVVQAIKPVFMMSPVSVANFLPSSAVEFDLVIFDEASQVKPADALGAIVRGKQAVVVGDSKQLPPTSFFESMIAQDDETEEDDAVATSDIESILGLFCSRGAHQRMLRWHYRSKHESLIAGSNHLFYDNRLVVFPSPDRQKENVGLLYRRVESAFYDRSKTRTNPGEATAIAEAVMKHALEQVQRPKDHRLTLGVAALSVAQRDAILDRLEILRKRSPQCEEFLNDNESFFVKNLESIQGDERDVIFISIGYGRTSEGYLAMSFGPVNRAGGERRLNVLFSRARRRCEVFTTLQADDIDTGGKNLGGVYALKVFLQYAEHGFLDVPISTGRPPDSPFEEQVLIALQRLGYTVHTQVGSAGFYLDLAVVDPSCPGRYLLGIECDGAAYHSARSTRDRDRLRQSVLEALGWNIHRIWSTAWFRNPAGELESVCKAIEESRDKAQSTLAPDYGASQEGSANESGSASQSESSTIEARPLQRSIPALPKYVLANLKIDLGYEELHTVSLDTLSQWLARVVAVESPIHWLDAARRVAGAADVHRIGTRIQEAFQHACQSGAQSKRFVYRDGFLWLDETVSPLVRDRSDLPAQLKKLEYIAPEEIGAAIEQSVGESFGLEAEDVAVAVCRMLGFARVSDDMRRTVENLRDRLMEEGRLVRRGETLICKNATK
jgi:very-short-patch-repair endonuclease